MSHARRKPARIAAAVLALGCIAGVVLALTWADWFTPTFPVLVASFIVAAALSATLLWRQVAATIPSAVGRVGVVGMGAVFFWFGLALALPALVTAAIGQDRTVSAKVMSYEWGSQICGFRLVLDEFAPPGGGYCRAGQDADAFSAGERVIVEARSSWFGVHVLGFVPARVNKSAQSDAFGAADFQR